MEIKVARGDDGSSPVRVGYATTDATARAGQDYTSTSGTLIFDPGVQGENEASATVDVTTTNGTAIAGSDYLGLTNTVHFAPGERLKRIQIPILNDELKEAAKSFLVRLSNPSAGTALGPRRTATVITYDNDSGVGFTSTKFFAPASAGAAEVVVRRSSDAPIGPLTVEYETVDGSDRRNRQHLGAHRL